MNATQTALLQIKWLHASRRSEVEVIVSHLSNDERESFIAKCQANHDRHADMDAKRDASGYPFGELHAEMKEDTASMAASIGTMRKITGPIGALPDNWQFEQAA